MPAPERGTVYRAEQATFRRLLLRWFQNHNRDLPWRGETDPYRILVSEIMLQQTRVAVVEARYKKFVVQFPTARRLAAAKEQTVLAAWSGLGYYRRARALHRAAKEIVGRETFPATAVELMELPGVGRYTAAAVASIAFHEPVAVVDGNVKRVIQRVAANQFPANHRIREDHYWEIAGRLLDKKHPGNFNQAMMELGALVCLPARPLCGACPVADLCALRGPAEKVDRPARRKAVLHYALIRKNGSVLLRQRPGESSLMPGMWELPQITPANSKTANVKAANVQIRNQNPKPLLKLRHSITTTDYTVFVHASANLLLAGRWVPLRSVDRLPLTGLTRKIIQRLGDA
ncbi:MAG TPA: A/G-specific adenine glycosylase [Candidatus Angelobacter sp.]|jgi:A/G-specific adenine glycosylase